MCFSLSYTGFRDVFASFSGLFPHRRHHELRCGEGLAQGNHEISRPCEPEAELRWEAASPDGSMATQQVFAWFKVSSDFKGCALNSSQTTVTYYVIKVYIYTVTLSSWQ